MRPTDLDVDMANTMFSHLSCHTWNYQRDIYCIYWKLFAWHNLCVFTDIRCLLWHMLFAKHMLRYVEVRPMLSISMWNIGFYDVEHRSWGYLNTCEFFKTIMIVFCIECCEYVRAIPNSGCWEEQAVWFENLLSTSPHQVQHGVRCKSFVNESIGKWWSCQFPYK